MDVKALRERAMEESCPAGAIDDARMTEAPKESLTLLIMESRAATRAATKAALDRAANELTELTLRLEAMDVKALVALAEETAFRWETKQQRPPPGFEEGAIEKALEQDFPKPALVRLLTAEEQTRKTIQVIFAPYAKWTLIGGALGGGPAEAILGMVGLVVMHSVLVFIGCPNPCWLPSIVFSFIGVCF